MQGWLMAGVMLLLLAAAIVTSMWKAKSESRAEALPRPAKPCRIPAREFSLVVLPDAFEPETACLWEPQLELLQTIGNAGPEGLEYEQLRPLHDHLAARYPELYEGSDLESWLEAMEREELIAWMETTVRLTPAGAAFLRWRLPITV